MNQHASSLQKRPVWASTVRSIDGVVQHGRKLGRQLGFPTANVALAPGAEPTYGVYAARTQLSDGRIFNGVASVGVRPTVGGVEPLLEVWLFGFDEDIYGATIRTELVKFLRGEEKFDSLEILTRQVMADAQEAKRVLGLADRVGHSAASSAPILER